MSRFTKSGYVPIFRRISWAVLLLAAAVALNSCRQRVKTGPADVLFITIDTLRADHLGLYGYKFIKTPNIDELGREGAVFQQCRTVVPLTLPSHTSIFTGLYPASHGVMDNGSFKASPKLTTLAEVFKENGYNTGAVVGSYVLDSRYGLEQGFDYYDDSGFVEAEGGKAMFFYPERKAGEVADRALAWLKSLYGPDSQSESKKRRFFLWVHFFDPHAVYEPPAEFMAEYPKALYDGEIAYTDQQVGRLLDNIREMRGSEDLIVVLMSDHGESLGEHGELTHGVFVYDATTHVPLIINAPGRIPAGRVPWRVRTIDVAPTVLELAGISDKLAHASGLEPFSQGESLVKMMEGKGKDRPVFMESMYPMLHFGWSVIRGLAAGGYTVIDAPKPELYEWRGDPHQERNIASHKPALTKSYIKRLNTLLKALHNPSLARESRGEMNDEARKMMNALGYITTGEPLGNYSDEIIEVGGPNPAGQKFFQLYFAQIITAFTEKNYRKAIEKLDKLLKSDPKNKWLMLYKGEAYKLNGDMEKARREYLKVLEIDPNYLDALAQLAWLEYGAGNLDLAESYAGRAIERHHEDADMYSLLAKVEVKRGDRGKAKELLKLAIEIAPSEVDALMMLGTMLLEEGDTKEAGERFEEALKRSPHNISVLNSVGETRLKTGDRKGAVEVFDHAASLSPDSALEWYYLGLAYETGDDGAFFGKSSGPEKAVYYYVKAIELNPDLEKARARLQAVRRYIAGGKGTP